MENLDKPCTEAQRHAIIQEAAFRRGFVLWLAAHLERDGCTELIRKEAAQALRQLVS